MFKMKMLYAFMLPILGVMPEGQSAISPETLEAMPNDVKNAGVPVGRNWTESGKALGQKILAAEQGITSAQESLVQTKKDGLLEIATLEELERAQYIGGVDSTFRMSDGDKLSKTHGNYLTDLRRVSNAVKLSGVGPVCELLKKTGKYSDVVASLPRAGNAGGQNRGTGVSAAVKAATEAARTQGAAAVVGAVADLSKAPERHSTQPAETLATVMGGIQSCNEDQIEPIAATLAKRCGISPNPKLQELGKAIMRIIDEVAGTDATQQAAANTPQPMENAA